MGRVDGEGEKEEKKAIIINNIKIVIALAIYNLTYNRIIAFTTLTAYRA